MQKTKVLYFITRMDQGGAQASVLLTLKNVNKQQFATYLATGPGGRLDGKLKHDSQNVFFTRSLECFVLHAEVQDLYKICFSLNFGKLF